MGRWWIRAAVSVALLAVLLTYVPVRDLLAAVAGVNPLVWIASVVVFVCGHASNAMKLRVLVGPDVAPVAACLRAHFAGIAANLGLPGVVGGDVVRVAYLAPTAGTARVAVAAVMDRIVDSSVLLVIVVASASVAGVPPALEGATRRGAWWLAGAAVAIAGLVWIGRRWVRRRGAGAGVREAWGAILARPGAVGTAILMSAGVQAVFVLTNVWLASEVGLTMALAPWFLAWTGAKLSAVLPISLGGLGVREAALTSILVAYGAPGDLALATGVLWDGALIAGSAGGFLLTQWLRR